MFKKLLCMLFLISLLFTSRHELVAQEKGNYFIPDFIPVSTWYSGGKARAPMLSEITPLSGEEWKKDLEQIKALGFNTVRTWVEWAHCEPEPGKYNFENLKLLCQLAQEAGLRVFVQIYVDSAPDWVGEKHPDGRFEADDGEKINSQSAPGYCTDHKKVGEAVYKFYSETAKITNQFTNFYGWDLWSEPHIVNWASMKGKQFCFCPSTQARFQQWLKDKYKTVDALNKAWYRNFKNFSDAQPPRFSTILSYTDFIDWKNFIYQKLAGDLRSRYEAIRKEDKSHVITSHAAVPSLFYSPYNGYGSADDFLMAEQVNYYGTSLYPKHNHPDRHWPVWQFMVAADFSRSANKKNGGFYVGELQAGKGTIGLTVGNPVTPEDHTIWMWSVISKGAKAINIYAYYPMSSGYESDGYGLINLDGTVTERAKNAGEIARIIDQNKELFLKSSPVKAQIALVYNPLAQMVGGTQQNNFGDFHLTSLIGYYRFFAENNIPVDFIHRKDIESGDLSQYKIIIVPYPLMFTQKAADGLKAFVKNGGNIVAEARLAWNDERGYAANVIPGLGLSEIFGVKESKVRMQDKGNVLMKISKKKSSLASSLNSGDYLKGNYFAESLVLLPESKAEIIAVWDDDSPAITSSLYEKGKGIFIGSFLGAANHPNPDSINDKFLYNLIDWGGIERPFTTSKDGDRVNFVEVRLQENSDGYLLFLINHSEQEQAVEINLNVKENGDYEFKRIDKNFLAKGTAIDKVLKVNSILVNRGVNVISIKKL